MVTEKKIKTSLSHKYPPTKSVPTEIKGVERLYKRNGFLFMTVPVCFSYFTTKVTTQCPLNLHSNQGYVRSEKTVVRQKYLEVQQNRSK